LRPPRAANDESPGALPRRRPKVPRVYVMFEEDPLAARLAFARPAAVVAFDR
jgi:hypothetical protein